MKKQLLEARLRQDTAFDIRDYGKIVLLGYGAPTEVEKDMLRESYGADVEFAI